MSKQDAPLDADTRRAVAGLLESLCAQHGIAKVPALEWSRRMRRTLGRAYVRQNLVRLSAWLDATQAENTLRHELAHIAVGASRRRKPHGPDWQDWAVRLGIEPRATAHLAPANVPAQALERRSNGRRWGLECANCGLRLVRTRVIRGLYHRDCGPRKGKLVKVLRATRDEVVAWAGAWAGTTNPLPPDGA